MKFAIPLVLVAVLALAGALALSLNDGPSQKTASPTTTVANGDAATDPAAALAALAEAYRNMPPFRETIDQSFTTSGGQGKSKMEVAFDADDNAELLLPGSRIVITDDGFFMTLDLVKHKYLKGAAVGDAHATFLTSTGSKITPVTLALRAAASPRDQIAALAIGLLTNPRPQAVATVTREDGTTQRKLTLAGDDGSAQVFIDPSSGLLAEVVVEQQPAQGPKRTVWSKITTTTQTEPIRFDEETRFRVDSLATLKASAVGEPAPELVLPTLAGETVTLSDHRGSVVVLDFWATWCGPCRRGLPMLNEFHVWAEKSGKPIKVLAVDVWERDPDPAVNRRAVESFWRESGFLMPTLIDVSGDAVYPFGFRSIPTTIIIGPDGRIVKIHTGYDEKMVETLKNDVQQILADA